MNFDAEKIRAFVVNDILGKVVSRIIPGIVLFIVINRSLQIRTPSDSFIDTILAMIFYWIIGFTMEFYNRHLPLVKRLYDFSRIESEERQSFIRLFQNIVFAMAWSVIISLLVGTYRNIRSDLPFYFHHENHQLAPYEFEVVATGLALVFFFVAFLMFRGSLKSHD